MTAQITRLRDDLAAVRDAALAAVRPGPLVADRVAVVAGELLLDGRPLDPPVAVGRGRIMVVGGGKAAAGMAAGLVEVLVAGGVAAERITGVVSVPGGSGRRLAGVEVRATRPPAENLPTPAVVAATREMLALVATLGPEDLAVAVVSGGGSALVAAPRQGITLEDKIAVTRFLSGAGADITALNVVRQAASDVKGGGLARACTAGRLLVLVLSDVIGDPLGVIASGPCMPVAAPAAAALAVLERFGAVDVAPTFTAMLRAESAAAVANRSATGACPGSWTTPRGCGVDHVLLGTNTTAVEAAAQVAERLGYEVAIRPAAPGTSEPAEHVGRRLAHEGLALVEATRADGRPRAIVEGGEAIVRLPADHGRGGRNQSPRRQPRHGRRGRPDRGRRGPGRCRRRGQNPGTRSRRGLCGGPLRRAAALGGDRRPRRHRPHRHERGRRANRAGAATFVSSDMPRPVNASMGRTTEDGPRPGATGQSARGIDLTRRRGRLLVSGRRAGRGWG
ncbi:MAG: DUF4147 domain-containing protein [Planctomycetia bacterium]|nr:DUF4147 domain-containing protein [Planctomycetia bacterium]